MTKKEKNELYKLKLEAYKGNNELEKIFLLLNMRKQSFISLKNELQKVRENIEIANGILEKIPRHKKT